MYRTFLLYCKFPESEYPKIRIAEKFDEEGNKMYEKLRGIFAKENLYNRSLSEYPLPSKAL